MIFAVIFRAKIKRLDNEYYEKAQRMRELALNQYGCIDLTSVSEGGMEISISYWKNERQITRWKQDPEHLEVQRLGKSKWYESYQVDVVKLQRRYNSIDHQ